MKRIKKILFQEAAAKMIYAALGMFICAIVLGSGILLVNSAPPGESWATIDLGVAPGDPLTADKWNGLVNAIGGAMPSGAVMAFNLAACPAGWSEFTSARGRYIVGLPNGGNLGATVGTGLSNTENRPVGQHSHNVNDPGHSHGINTSYNHTGGWGAYNYQRWYVDTYQTDANTTGITIDSSGTVTGTNAPYIQLLICQKN